MAQSPCLAQSDSYRTQGYLPRGGTGHRGLGPPTIIVHQENDHTCLSADLTKAIP